MDSLRNNSNSISRRNFLKTTATSASAIISAPAVHAASKTNSEIILGKGDYKYRVEHDCVTLPSPFNWQITHNVAVDSQGLLYVIHEGDINQKNHPAIFVFDQQGRYVRSFGQQFQGGGHGLEVRHEAGEDFLYVTGYQHLKTFAKLSLKGETIWQKYAPMESKLYATGEDTHPQKKWGRDRFLPTNFAFHPDGGFYLADGYGAWQIHRYNQAGKWQFSFGGAGKKNGEFQLPHGLWIDDRQGRTPSVVVADRANARLQWFSLEGKHQQTKAGFILPANADTHKELLLVPDLASRITLLDSDNKIISHLGEDPEWSVAMKSKPRMRTTPKRWQAGRFVHPHDACFDKSGNIFVAEWVATGRISKLIRIN